MFIIAAGFHTKGEFSLAMCKHCYRSEISINANTTLSYTTKLQIGLPYHTLRAIDPHLRKLSANLRDQWKSGCLTETKLLLGIAAGSNSNCC